MKDGGSVFPNSNSCGNENGLTLRDWFAGQALAGYVVRFPETGETLPERAAEYCYEMADAMLANRHEYKER
jgi:hypothetical protein